MRITLAVILSIALCVAVGAATEVTDGWIAELEGGWSGQDNATPMGQMPFALLFERQDDGSLRARTAMNRETFIELTFRRAADGRWLLDERAGMEGLGEQAYTLEPVEAPGELHRWALPDSPEFLRVDVALGSDTLFMDVVLRGEPHAQFDLTRLPDDALPKMREALEEASQLEPADRSIHEFANGLQVPPAILEARAAVAAAPDDARAYLGLGMAIGNLLSTDSMTYGPRFAGEMLESLRRALELDPTIPETYRWLAGYYLNAPPIAGGSVDKAEALARQLAEVNPDAGAELLSQVERSREGSDGASH